MIKLPEGWVYKTIKQVNTFKSSSINPMNYRSEVFELFSVPSFPSGAAEISEGSAIGSTKQLVDKGDVLLCKINPRINRVWTVSEPKCLRQIASSEWIVVRSDLHNSDFLKYFFRSQSFRDILCSDVSGVGGSLTRAKPKLVEEYEVPVAPLAEQTRIVEKLDEVLAQVDTIKARLDGIPAILKRFRQSVLAAAVSGRLTEEWRGTDPTDFNQSPITVGKESINSPDTWAWTKLLDLAKLESGHTPRKTVSEYWENGDVYWICLQDIRAAHGKIIEDTKFKPTMKGIENSSARLLPKGTVCFSRDISVGFTTIMGKEMSTTQHFANWICGKQLFNKYLMFALMAAKRHLTDTGQGTTVKTIYMPALKDFYLLTPPIEEQKEIVRLVDQYFAFADTIEAQVKKAQARVDKLTQSILAKAFRGELVAQDPGDEPADKLLERIAAARAEADALAKTAKKVGRKQATA